LIRIVTDDLNPAIKEEIERGVGPFGVLSEGTTGDC
jgi:hypothetical protein